MMRAKHALFLPMLSESVCSRGDKGGWNDCVIKFPDTNQHRIF
jgi:hypothetical protein